MNREYFSFELSTGIDLALPLTDMKVAAQFEVRNICIIPGVADFWYGVTNYKGSLVWVLDSDRFLNGAGDIKAAGNPQPRALANAPASRRDFEAVASVPLMGVSPTTAQHRFFNINNINNINKSDRQSSKITAVILQQRQAQKKLALVTSQLKGIISVEPDSLKSIEDDTSLLSKCCNAVVQTEALSTYIIEPTALLQQLQKRSLLNASPS